MLKIIEGCVSSWLNVTRTAKSGYHFDKSNYQNLQNVQVLIICRAVFLLFRLNFKRTFCQINLRLTDYSAMLFPNFAITLFIALSNCLNSNSSLAM